MAMTEVAQATVTIIPNMKGSQKTIATELGASAGNAGDAAGVSLGKRLVGAIGKIGIGAAVTKMVKDSIDEGAKLQQSFGGLDTLYGDASEAAKKYAEDAWKAGISANDYAEQAVSFGASLKKAFGGDTAKAAEAANTAIMDMADNAAKMGTPLESIQNAYQGFAKGQYNMLDNLKLGYGGTKAEMERLLKDAQKISGVEYNIDNLGDVYEAIHVIQDELGLANVAAQEASDTFSGSFGAMKAAASNLLANLALGKNIWKPLKDLEGAVKTFLVGNLLPMIGNILTKIPGILTSIPEFLTDLFPEIVPVAGDLVIDLVDAIVDNIPIFIDGIWQLFKTIGTVITKIDWIGVANELLTSLTNAVAGIWDSVTNILRADFGIDLPDWETVVESISGLWDKVKTGIADFFKAAFDIITDDDKSIIEKISGLWTLVKNGIGDLFKGYFNLVIPAYETVISTISNWWGTNVWPAIQDFFKSTFGVELPDWEEITKPIKEGWEKIKEGISGLFSVLFGVETPTVDDVVETLNTLWSGIWDGITGLFSVLFGIDLPTWEDVTSSIKGLWTSVEEGISGFFKKIFGVTLPSWEDIVRGIKEVWESVKTGIKNFFDKVFSISMPTWDDVVETIKAGWEAVKKGITGLFGWVFNLDFPSIDEIVEDLKEWWNGVVKGIGDFFTLKWILGDPEDAEVYDGFSGAGKKFEVKDDNVSIDSEAIQKALADANLKLSDIDTSSLDKAKKAVAAAVSAMEASFTASKVAIPTIGTTALTMVKNAIATAVSNFKSSMNFYWSLPTLHGRLPIISVTMNEVKNGKTSVNVPSIGISGFNWFAEGGIFNEPQVIGIGDSKGPEAAVPLDKMWERMSQEFDKHLNGGAQVTNYFQVDGAQDPEAWAMNAARTIKRELRMA